MLRPVDWPSIVRDLEISGMTVRAIGKMVGTSHAAVIGWKNMGKEPGHYTGERVLTLWCAVTGRPKMEATVSKDTGTVTAHCGHAESID